MTEIEQYFRLSEISGVGVRCDESGLFVGEIALLERASGGSGQGCWRPRATGGINRDLGKLYGASFKFAANVGGLDAVARALNRNDVVHAQIATLLIGIPEPPAIDPSRQEPATLGRAIRGQDDERATRPSDDGFLKFNPHHDERGRFTSADGAVQANGDGDKAPEHQTQTKPHETRTSPNASTTRPAEDSDVPAIAQATATIQSCGDAFRACVQIAAFRQPSLISNCIAALRVCKTTGLPTIFGPGTLGQQ